MLALNKIINVEYHLKNALESLRGNRDFIHFSEEDGRIIFKLQGTFNSYVCFLEGKNGNKISQVVDPNMNKNEIYELVKDMLEDSKKHPNYI